ncbi:hypothetical protein BDV18DRAFT_112732 [Aspergillus unguis]
MLATTLTLALGVTISLSNALPSSTHSKHDSSWSSTKNLIAFGDSYTFIQGTAGYPNYSFIGDAFNYAYDAETLLSDKIVQNQTGTAEGGPNWVEYLTGCGLEEGLTSPISCKTQLWNFAFAGSGVSEEFIPLHHNYTISFVNQIKQFTTYGHSVLAGSSSDKHNPKGKPILSPSETLIAIWIGINDINDSADYNLTSVEFREFYDTLVSTLFSSLDPLVELGYKQYLLLNLPPLDRTPSNQARSLKGEEPSPSAKQVQWFNRALSKHTQSFARRKRHSGVRAFVFDAHTVLSNVLDLPEIYGIKNTTDFCPGYDQPDIQQEYEKYGCPTPLNTYFWYNSGHTTARVHEILADKLEGVLKRWTLIL